jgi:hypothetical protein
MELKMPAKSKRRKGKYIPQRKPQTNVAAQQATAPAKQSAAATPVATTKTSVAANKGPASRSKGGTPQGSTQMAIPASYSTISREMKTIGIMGGALLIILVVIAIFLS